MISHGHRTIFVHVPKTGGTSIEAALGHHPGGEVVRDAQDHRTLRQLRWPCGDVAQLTSAANAREVALAVRSRIRPPAHLPNRQQVTRAQFRDYFKFAVVRNPWARTYSWYRNVSTDPLHRARLGVPADLEFPDFVGRFLGVDALRPQLHWLVDFDGRVGVDMVCRFENLGADFAAACRRADVGDVALPHLNGSGLCEHVAAFDDRSRRLVAERFRDEIEAFGYRFDGATPRASGPVDVTAPRG